MSRVRAAEWIAGAGGVAILASLWAGPAALAILLALAALPAIGLLAAQANCRAPALPVALGVLTGAIGVVAVLLAVVRVLDNPGTGAWIGLAGALGVLVGGWLSMRAELIPGEVPPHVPRRPAPPPSA